MTFPIELGAAYAVYSADIIELLLEQQQTKFGAVLAHYDVRSIVELDEELYETGRCLANAILYASRHEDHDVAGWQVVVGYATPAGNTRHLEHAWVVDPFGQAWDVTWRETAGVTYCGVALVCR